MLWVIIVLQGEACMSAKIDCLAEAYMLAKIDWYLELSTIQKKKKFHCGHGAHWVMGCLVFAHIF